MEQNKEPSNSISYKLMSIEKSAIFDTLYSRQKPNFILFFIGTIEIECMRNPQASNDRAGSRTKRVLLITLSLLCRGFHDSKAELPPKKSGLQPWLYHLHMCFTLGELLDPFELFFLYIKWRYWYQPQ